MTNDNYSKLTNQELVNVVEHIDVVPSKLFKILNNHHKHLLEEIIERTNFLNESDSSIFARLFCLKNNLTEQPTCQTNGCNNKVHWNKNKREFFHHCSNKCKNKDPIVQEKMQQTTMKHFGVKHSAQSQEIQSKQRSTSMARYGVEYASQTPEFRERVKQTCLKRFKAPSTFQSKEIQEKIRQTIFEKYGYKYFQSTDTFKKQCQETWFSHFGVNHPMWSDEIKWKVHQTHIFKWGCWYCQTPEFTKKSHMPYTNPKYPDISWATSWEFKVYDFLTEHNIPFEYQPDISIPFECEGTYHTYHPDFLVNDRLYEVKGDNFFRINDETGKEEMYLTWKGNLSNDKYEWKCKLYEAKHQCMIANNVVIIRGKELSDLASIFLK